MRAHLNIKKQGVTVINQKSKSFLIAFCGLMARQWCNADDTLDDTGGNSHTEGISQATFLLQQPGGYGHFYAYWSENQIDVLRDRRGIVIGSGTGTVVPNDSGLGTQIRSGEKTSTILYLGNAVHGLTVDTGTDTASFKILGIFKNISGGSIDVKEVGIYVNGNVGSQSYPNYFGYCILRDNITTISLADGEYLEVEYTISIAS